MDHVQPKRPVGGGYGQFLAANRAEFTEACKGQQASAISIMAGIRWKNLSAEQKKPYQQKFEEVKAIFERDMAAFVAAGGAKVLGSRALKTQKRKATEYRRMVHCARQDPIGLEMTGVEPKRPVGGGYGQFLAEKRAEFAEACKGQKASAVTIMAGLAWKNLTVEQKTPYQKKFEEAKAKFEKDMIAFVVAGGTKSLGIQALKTQKRKAMEYTNRGKCPEQDPIGPKKPVFGAFGIFLNRKRDLLNKQCPCHVMGITELASATWNVMSDVEKKPYEIEYAVKKEVCDEATKSYVPLCRVPKATNEGSVDGADETSGEKA
jgi:upstream-binding transcription factor